VESVLQILLSNNHTYKICCIFIRMSKIFKYFQPNNNNNNFSGLFNKILQINSISTNKCTVLNIMHFTINFLLHFDAIAIHGELTTKEDFHNCFRKWQERRISVFEARGSVVRGINGNVSFTVTIFFYLNIHRTFWSHLVYQCCWNVQQ